MNKSNSIDHLKNKETWSIEEVLELLSGFTLNSSLTVPQVYLGLVDKSCNNEITQKNYTQDNIPKTNRQPTYQRIQYRKF